VGRESSLDERVRKDKERADAIRERQVRQGVVQEESRDAEAEEPQNNPPAEEEKPAAKKRTRSKKSE
jgi:hypothetical protein